MILVPSRPPSNVTSTNFTSTSSATINWGPIPLGHVNGRLRGYQLIYTLLVASEIKIFAATSDTVSIGPRSFTLELQGLRAHSIYRVGIAGVTDAGVGVAEVIYVGRFNHFK